MQYLVIAGHALPLISRSGPVTALYTNKVSVADFPTFAAVSGGPVLHRPESSPCQPQQPIDRGLRAAKGANDCTVEGESRIQSERHCPPCLGLQQQWSDHGEQSDAAIRAPPTANAINGNVTVGRSGLGARFLSCLSVLAPAAALQRAEVTRCQARKLALG